MRKAFVITAALLAAGFATAGEGGGFVSPAVSLVDCGAEEICVRVAFPTPTAGPDLTIRGMARERIPGEPSLPYKPVLIAIPPSASVELSYESPSAVGIPGRRPAIFTGVEPDETVSVALQAPRSGPAVPVELDLDGYLRGRRVVRLVFRPLLVGDEGSVFHPQLTARLKLAGGESGLLRGPGASREGSSPEGGDRGAEAALYRATILNESAIDDVAYGRAMAALRQAHRPQEASTSGSPEGTGPLPAKIPVRSEGIWSVTHADLLAAGIDASGVASSDVSILAGGSPVPVRVVDGGDGFVDPGDRIEFFGDGIHDRVEFDANVYRVAFDEGPGLAMSTRSVVPAGGSPPGWFLHTEHFEINETLFTTTADNDGDRFGWVRMTAPSSGSPPGTRDFPDVGLSEPADLLSLPDVDPGSTTVHVRARIYHLAGTSHTTDLQLNGIPLSDTQVWSGVEVTHEVDTATTNLVASNVLTVELSGSSFNQVLFNWIEFDYQRLFRAFNDELLFSADLPAPVAHQVSGFTTPDIVLFDVTDPSTPVRLVDGQVSGSPGDYTIAFTDTLGGSRRFAARAGFAGPGGVVLPDTPSNLQDAGNGADLIILAYRDFLPDLAPLVGARQAEGLRVELIDLEDVFDEFAFGRADPLVIKDFVSLAYSTWQAPAPAYLLLVGNATLDPRQLLSGSVPPLMPTGTFLDPTLGLAATDNFFVTVAGGDPLPDLFSGRIPAQTPQEVADAVDRILMYPTIDPAILNQNLLLVADDDDPLFEALQEDMVSLFLSDTRIPEERAYLRLLGTVATNQKILDTMNAGALMVNFLGHGNIHNWAAENILVDTIDIPSLTNFDRPSFVTTLNCVNGFHAAPRAPHISSLAEQLVMDAGGGAIAAWSPSGLGTLVDYQRLQEVLFRLLFTDRVQRLGVATTLAKVEAYTDFGISEINLEEMTLFGDPSLVLRVDGDADGLTDAEEDACACALDARDGDTDDDGRVDGDEPSNPVDSDGDGLPDVLDPDADDDGLPDGLEAGIDVADLDTDLAAGFFVADLDPLSVTDPAAADSDGGGAADGAEDRNANGQVDGLETDPNNPGDDPSCGPSPLPELANLTVTTGGADLQLAWDGIEVQDPCVLYRVLQADLGGAVFTSSRVTTQPTASLPGQATGPGSLAFLVVATRPDLGDGPTGH